MEHFITLCTQFDQLYFRKTCILLRLKKTLQIVESKAMLRELNSKLVEFLRSFNVFCKKKIETSFKIYYIIN